MPVKPGLPFPIIPIPVLACLCLLLSGLEAQTTRPLYRLISPRPFEVITNNSVQLAAEILDPTLNVKTVRFYVFYQDFTPTSEGLSTKSSPLWTHSDR
jgi:hypothetical protein